MTAARHTRERVRRPDGTVAVQMKPPRADVLWYPRYGWSTVLVRRTHDLTLARALAELKWAEVDDDRPLVASRTGWWRTYGHSSSTRMPAAAAEDHRGRIVEWVTAETPGAGPGIEFRR